MVTSPAADTSGERVSARSPTSSVETGPAGRVSGGTLFWYCLPQVPHGFALLPVVNFVPGFYSDHLGMKLSIVGLVMVLTRLLDTVTDPLFGAWSDRTRSRFGRRKPFIVGGLPILMAATWFVFTPGGPVTPLYLFAGLFFLYLGFTIVDIPYTAWGAELSSDYDERSRIAAWRGAANSAGSLVTLSIPVLLQLMGIDDVELTMKAMALCFLVLQPLCFALALWQVPEFPETRVTGTRLRWTAKWKVLLSNGPLMRVCLAMMLLIGGMAIGATLNMIIFKHVIGQPHYFAPAVFAQNVIAILAIPAWLALSRRAGKHRAVATGILMIGLCTGLTWFADRGDGWYLSALMLGIGASMGGALSIVNAMIADLVDRDTLETGEQRSGLFYAAQGIATKLAVVVGVLIGTAVPGLAGFQPSDASHSAASLDVLRFVYAWVCPVLAIPAAWLLWRYPVTRDTQRSYRRLIEGVR